VDIAAWLHGLGLQRYEPVFCDNDIDGVVLPSLMAEDLKDLDITSVGHRRRLLEAIAALHETGCGRAGRGVPPIADAERRQLTVMYCDFVGSTARRWYRGYKEVVIAVNAGRGEEVDPGAAERRLSYGEFESLPSASESCPTSQQISPAPV